MDASVRWQRDNRLGSAKVGASFLGGIKGLSIPDGKRLRDPTWFG